MEDQRQPMCLFVKAEAKCLNASRNIVSDHGPNSKKSEQHPNDQLQRAQEPLRPAKTSTERSREFRERKKALKNAASQELNISSSIITETTPKTPAERSRDYRARKRQKSEENQESNDLTRITVEVEVHQEQDNSQPSTSTLPIKRKKNFNRTCS
ncbi:hypothetical protein TNCV_3566741 [Trichonephila clavipes]|nr:hypothetical protein TNCV_3566741 [Trichonephila clavipes]